MLHFVFQDEIKQQMGIYIGEGQKESPKKKKRRVDETESKKEKERKDKRGKKKENKKMGGSHRHETKVSSIVLWKQE